VGAELARIVARALGRKPAQRYATADEMLRDLERLRTPTVTFEEDTTSQQPVSAGALPTATPVDAPSLGGVERGSASQSASGVAPAPTAPRSRRGLLVAFGAGAIVATVAAVAVIAVRGDAPPSPATTVVRASVTPPSPPASPPVTATAAPSLAASVAVAPAASSAAIVPTASVAATAPRTPRPAAAAPRETPPSVDGF
jgi:hypothetical protein